jgi:hypothetical protein
VICISFFQHLENLRHIFLLDKKINLYRSKIEIRFFRQKIAKMLSIKHHCTFKEVLRMLDTPPKYPKNFECLLGTPQL